MQERVRCPRCWKRGPSTARFCRRCGYCLKRAGTPMCAGGTGFPLLAAGIGLTAGILSLGWLMMPAPAPPQPGARVRWAPPPPPPAPYVQWGVPKHHRVGPPVDGFRWATPDGDVIVVPPSVTVRPPELPPPYRTRYVSPPRPRSLNPYLYGRPANPYVYPSPDAQDPQR